MWHLVKMKIPKIQGTNFFVGHMATYMLHQHWNCDGFCNFMKGAVKLNNEVSNNNVPQSTTTMQIHEKSIGEKLV